MYLDILSRRSSNFGRSSDIEESRLMTNVDGYDVNVSMDVFESW